MYESIGNIVWFNLFNEALLDLEAGRIDVVIIDEIMELDSDLAMTN